MRHFLSLRPPATHPGSVHVAATTVRLIVPPGLLNRAAARLARTVAGAVALTAVAATANDHLPAATGTLKQATRHRIGPPRFAALAETRVALGRIVGLHACPARCGARRRC